MCLEADEKTFDCKNTYRNIITFFYKCLHKIEYFNTMISRYVHILPKYSLNRIKIQYFNIINTIT